MQLLQNRTSNSLLCHLINIRKGIYDEMQFSCELFHAHAIVGWFMGTSQSNLKDRNKHLVYVRDEPISSSSAAIWNTRFLCSTSGSSGGSTIFHLFRQSHLNLGYQQMQHPLVSFLLTSLGKACHNCRHLLELMPPTTTHWKYWFWSIAGQKKKNLWLL